MSASASSRNSKPSVDKVNYDELKAIYENQIANRQYQLANALILQAENKKLNNWEEVTRRLGIVLRIDNEQKKNLSRVVKSHLLISNGFLG